MRLSEQSESPAITVFTVINFVFAGFAVLSLVLIGLVLIYGIFFSGDEGEELMAGVFGSVFIAFFLAVGTGVYLTAGIGLAKRKRWGYYVHIAGAILAAPSCLGVPYTVAALIFAFRPEFKDAFV